MSAGEILAAAAVLHAAVALVFTCICTLAVCVPRRTRTRTRDDASSPRRETFVLRPVDRPSAAWAARIAGEAAALAPASVIVAGGGLEAARATLERAGVHVIDDDPPASLPCNRKVHHLGAAARFAAGLGEDARAVVVQADADVVLSARDVRALVGAVEAGGPRDLVFALPAAPASTTAAQVVLMGSPQSFAVVEALARITGGAPAIAGKCVALRRSALDAIGGYAAIEHAIGDDVTLVERIVAVGGRVGSVERAVPTRDPDPTLEALLARTTRWLRVVRAHRPALLATYPLLIAPLPVAGLLVVASALMARSTWPLGALGALVAARALLAVVLARGPYRGQVRAARLVSPIGAVIADAVLLVALARALGERRVTWGQRVYDLGPGGRIRGVRAV